LNKTAEEIVDRFCDYGQELFFPFITKINKIDIIYFISI